MIALPPALYPPPPFPLVVAQSKRTSAIAPGVEMDTYHLSTSRGPLVVRAIAVDLHEPTVRVETVLANDSLRSPGETVSSMARRTGAVAGINADYFDIGQTNQPLNVVVRHGFLLRSPSGRATLTVSPGGSLRLGTYAFNGSVTAGDRKWTLEGVNEWPPQGSGAMLLLPMFSGTNAAYSQVALAQLEPLGSIAPSGAGDYQVAEAHAQCAPACSTLAFGARAAQNATLPVPGESVHLDAALDPPLPPGSTAVGGGPQLVKDGQAYSDPDPPSPAEALQHDPQAGALKSPDGSLGLVAVDGRDRARSIGLTRPELTALFLGMHAIDAMAFDSGGSATLVARVPGDALASVRNVPSDGHERAVADGLFIYSDAPRGPAAQLAVRPQDLELLKGASVAVRAIPLDAAGHPVAGPVTPPTLRVEPPSLARVESGTSIVAVNPGTGVVIARQGTLSATVALNVVATLGGLRIAPRDANPNPGQAIAFRADGTDDSGAPVELGDRVQWTATAGSVDATGRYVAGSNDATVSASAAGRRAQVTVRVGHSQGQIAAFDPRVAWRFETVPSGGTGSVALDTSDPAGAALVLRYDFDRERAAYATAGLAIPGRPTAISLELRGDPTAAGVRASFDNADGDRIAVTLARKIDWTGWKRCEVTLPLNATPPLRLHSLYVVTLGGPAPHGTGSVAFRNLRATFAGSGSGT